MKNNKLIEVLVKFGRTDYYIWTTFLVEFLLSFSSVEHFMKDFGLSSYIEGEIFLVLVIVFFNNQENTRKFTEILVSFFFFFFIVLQLNVIVKICNCYRMLILIHSKRGTIFKIIWLFFSYLTILNSWGFF